MEIDIIPRPLLANPCSPRLVSITLGSEVVPTPSSDQWEVRHLAGGLPGKGFLRRQEAVPDSHVRREQRPVSAARWEQGACQALWMGRLPWALHPGESGWPRSKHVLFFIAQCLENPRGQEPGGPRSTGSQRVGKSERLHTAQHSNLTSLSGCA